MCSWWVVSHNMERRGHRHRRRDAYHYCIPFQHLFTRRTTEPVPDSSDANCSPLCCYYYRTTHFSSSPYFQTLCITRTSIFILYVYMDSRGRVVWWCYISTGFISGILFKPVFLCASVNVIQYLN